MTTYIVCMALYFFVAFAIAIYYSKKKTKSNADFTVGGRRFGKIFVFFMMLAAYLGAGTTIGTTGWVWKRGLSQIWFTLGYTVVFAFIGICLAGRIRRFGARCNAYTFADFLEIRYNKPARYMGSVLMIIAFLAIAAFQYIGMGRIINTVTGIDYTLAVVISAGITILYTSYGGMNAVAITGVIKGTITIIGILIMVPIVATKAGGIQGIMAAVPAEHFSLIGYVTPMQALTWFMVFFLGIIPMQDWWQRALSAKSEADARQGIFYMAIGFCIIEFIIYIVGFSGRVLEPNIDNPENLFPVLVVSYLPPYIGGLVMAEMIAIITSTAAACLLVPSTHFTRDFYQGLFRRNASETELLKVSKWSTFCCGILVLVFVFAAPGMFELWVMSADILAAAASVPILAGFFAPRVGSKAGFLSMVAGFAGWLISYMGWEPFGLGPAMVGAIFSLIAIVIGAMVFPPADRAVLEKLGFLEEDQASTAKQMASQDTTTV